MKSDMAYTLHGEAVLANFLVAKAMRQACLDALQRTICGKGRGVSGTAVGLVHTHDMIGFLEDVFEIVDVDRDVFGRDVAAV